jgi:glycosyltransferase involved in cell wall biosynthesis
MDLSIVIPSRNEMFLAKTIENILENIQGDTEIIPILDGQQAGQPIPIHNRVRPIVEQESIGQRAATNKGIRNSNAKFVMKCDAHCAFDKGFDVKLMETFEYNWTVVPRMYNLHAFDWKCNKCGNRTYQGPTLTKCEKCGSTEGFERVMVWMPRWNRCSDFMRFDKDLHFQYWGEYKKRPEAQGEICDLLCNLGACWMMHRDRYWELDGLDESHGSWGQMGVEISCKSWLSGGRQVINKKTWFAHMFRTQGGDFGFPYSISNGDVDKARKHSKSLWMHGTWPKAKHDLKWLINKFSPVPTWESMTAKKDLTKGIVYYTDNLLNDTIAEAVRTNLKRSAAGMPIVSTSLKPIDFGINIPFSLERGYLTMFKQILAGLEKIDTDIVFLCEHDILYSREHFEFTPMCEDVYYYNENTWKVDANPGENNGQALFYYCKQTSGLCAYRKLLINHYRKRVERVAKEGYSRNMGFEPGTHSPPRGVDNYKAESYFTKMPNVDIRHGTNLTKSRWSQDQFRNKNTCTGWRMADEIPGWGMSKGRFNDFLQECVRP